jgi:hypothetical protein
VGTKKRANIRLLEPDAAPMGIEFVPPDIRPRPHVPPKTMTQSNSTERERDKREREIIGNKTSISMAGGPESRLSVPLIAPMEVSRTSDYDYGGDGGGGRNARTEVSRTSGYPQAPDVRISGGGRGAGAGAGAGLPAGAGSRQFLRTPEAKDGMGGVGGGGAGPRERAGGEPKPLKEKHFIRHEYRLICLINACVYESRLVHV